MGRPRLSGAVALGAALWLPGVATGQINARDAEAPRPAPVRLGPFVLAPTVTLSNFGWDSNVFHLPVEAEPVGDMTANFRPEVLSWLRFGALRFRGRNTLDLAYFQQYSSERSIDGFHEGHVEVRLGAVTPYASAGWIGARQQFGYEIDDRTRRTEQSGAAGVDLRLGLRTSIDIAARRGRLEFTGAGTLRDPLVSEFYDYTSRGVSVAVRHELTPVTSAFVTASRYTDRFDLAPERDSESMAIGGALEFEPAGALSGRVFVGRRTVRLIGTSESFEGLAASADLTYVLLDATRFRVEAQRDLTYSAMRGQHAYLLEGARTLITHRLNTTWDVVARLGRHRLSYGIFESAGPGPAERNREIVTDYGGELGYRLGPDTRLSFLVGRQHRRSTVGLAREYERLRAGMSVQYRF